MVLNLAPMATAALTSAAGGGGLSLSSIGGMLGGLGSLVGGLFGSSGGMSQNKQLALNLRLMKEQERISEEAAQNGVQWRVADARAAGISPLVALGMQPVSSSATPVGFDANTGKDFSFLGQAGSDIGRALQASADPMTKAQLRLINAQVDGQEIENAMRASQLAKQTAQTGPSVPGLVGNPLKVFDTYTNQNGVSDRYISQEMSNVVGNSPRDLIMQYGLQGWDDLKYMISQYWSSLTSPPPYGDSMLGYGGLRDRF